MRKLFLLTAVVTLVHALLLWAAPAKLPLFAGRPDGLVSQARATGFVTRSIAVPALQAPSTQAVAPLAVEPPARAAPAAPVAGLAPVKKVALKSTQAPAPVTIESATAATAPGVAATPLAPATSEAPESSPISPVSPAPLSVQLAAANTTQAEAAVTTRAVPAIEARTPASAPKAAAAESNAKPRTESATEAKGASTASAGSSAARAPKVVYPPPARLLYDGKGEEKGFLKYNAGGELLWAPDGKQYNAKLEITFLLARLRTWTSKGELSDSGLQPIRFGDKPRGAEQATHFQRDKGIISFSANNPDVPLQPGAQDKLSAILQLTALMAGAPTRYGAGSVIRFQAADAHRAELWDFKVGAAEPLELPGGNVNGIKLTKEPTVEFDQRIEVWLAPDMGYLPVRLRITEANSAFVDLLWRKTQKPD